MRVGAALLLAIALALVLVESKEEMEAAVGTNGNAHVKAAGAATPADKNAHAKAGTPGSAAKSARKVGGVEIKRDDLKHFLKAPKSKRQLRLAVEAGKDQTPKKPTDATTPSKPADAKAKGEFVSYIVKCGYSDPECFGVYTSGDIEEKVLDCDTDKGVLGAVKAGKLVAPSKQGKL